MGSMSIKNLRSSIQERTLTVFPDRNYNPRKSHVIINWGNSEVPKWYNKAAKVYNKPEAVAKAINKLTAFREFKLNDVPIPEFTTSHEEATKWLSEGATIVVRGNLNGHGGSGISIHSEGNLARAPLYVKYKKKRKEFRVHVFNGKVIDVLEKRKRNGFNDLPDANPYIRSHGYGWVFCHNSIVKPDTLDEVAIKAVSALGLDFGGVDIIWNEKENKCYVLEVNTAPGVEESSVLRYVETITSL